MEMGIEKKVLDDLRAMLQSVISPEAQDRLQVILKAKLRKHKVGREESSTKEKTLCKQSQ